MYTQIGLIAIAIGCAGAMPCRVAALNPPSGAPTGAFRESEFSATTIVAQLRTAESAQALASATATGSTLADARLSELLAELRRAGLARVQMTIDPPAEDTALAARVGLDRFVTLVFSDPIDTRALSEKIAAEYTDVVQNAAPEAFGRLHGTPPNDPGFGWQWHIHNTGQPIETFVGVPGADIRWLEAVAALHDPAEIIVAVIDTGVSISHPDLIDRLVPGVNCTSNPPNGNTDDQTQDSHGTKCAGIITAARDNGIGIAGVAPNSKVMPIKIAIPGFGAAPTWAANGLRAAADRGARIASMSWGFGNEPVLSSAVQYAHGRGVLMIASTGNTGDTQSVPVGFPAAYAEVIAVGATNNQDGLWSGTTTGPEMDVVAPGKSIYTTVDQSNNPNGYGYQDGTSFAVPIVAGVAALVWGVNPALTAAEVRRIIEVSVDDLGAGGYDTTFGHGRVNAYAAVREALASLPACAVDLNGNHVADVGDLFYFLDLYFDAFGMTGPNLDFVDFDNNGVVSVEDLFAFMQAWFTGC